ncbi:EamA family transporter [Phenylobacterium montanum]|uniref:EamA family transporter n=1 Tax=Phenylobacterium montanum TaxID=2823693 RepID=A0A975FXX7_9CAUL|nr:EamA family transporter [Caulobacter sp. S6]QUD87455.1 EamA family transporter [Caulobacter sp. S6]
MSPAILGLVLAAALLHASWNALLKQAGDRRWMTIVMQLTSMAVAGVVAVFLPLPASHSWPWLVAGAIVHIGYNIFLVRALSLGDLGEIYPISRGASPVMVAAGAAIAAHDHLTLQQVVGIAVVSGGIVSLRRGAGRPMPAAAILVALATAGFTAAYTIIDGMGARQSAGVASYIAWLWVLDGVFTGGWFLLAQRRDGGARPSLGQTATGAVGGLIAMAAYSAVILATTLGALGAVSALRETSVLFAAVIGALFLGERLTAARLLSCLAIVAGSVIISLG